MTKVKFTRFWLMLTMSLVTIMFNSCDKDDNLSRRSPTSDKGVVINGVKWATRNVDKPGTFAAKPEDTGMFYQWNRKIGWSATNPTVNSNGGTIWEFSDMPTGTIWEKKNDPSPVGWRVPSHEEIQSLLDLEKVSIEQITVNNVKGVKFTDRISGNSIFLPAAGMIREAGIFQETWGGSYWSSTLYTGQNARTLKLGLGGAYDDEGCGGSGNKGSWHPSYCTGYQYRGSSIRSVSE